MKKTILSTLLFITAFAGTSQNLVPNGDFEQYYACPTSFGQIDSAKFWINPTLPQPLGSSPDYFNQCALTPPLGVPDNNFGFQPAHSGNAYCGAIIWYGGATPNYRENIETSLTAPLTANQCYYFEMYVALAEMSDHTTSSIGVYFSDTLVSGIASYFPLPFTPQIVNTTGFITDTMNWTLISGTYTASGGEQYLIIGNFYDDANTSTQPTNFFGAFQEAYFYIDDVSLTPCTGIEKQNENTEIKIYPNPVKDELKIQSAAFKIKDIRIFDTMGKEVYRTAPLTSDFRLPTSAFQSGIYFIEINNGKNIYRKKFLKE